MKTSIFTSGVFAGLALSQATVSGTSGRFKVGYWEDPSLPRHTIYGPIDPPAGHKAPVLIWGNSACIATGVMFRAFLAEIVSHGMFAISNGAMNGVGATTAQWQQEALEWVTKQGGTGKYSYVDNSWIAAAGQSCGGLESYKVGADKRIKTIGIFNSGEFTEAAGKATAAKVGDKPIFFFLGGPTDIAYANVSMNRIRSAVLKR